MKIKVCLALSLAAAAFWGCNNLELPENWKEQNIINIENESFNAVVQNIDPEQNWNVASMNPTRWASHITVASIPSADTKAFGGGGNSGGGTSTGTGTNTGSSSSSKETTSVGDYFVIAEGSTLPITFNTMDCWATQTIGLYYYDDAGEMVKVVLYEGVQGKKWTANNATEKAKTAENKSVTIEGGQCFGLYIETHTGPDVDSYYTENEDHIWYSESSLNEDGIGHVQLRTVTTTTSTSTGSGRNKQTTTTTSYEYYLEFEDSYSGGAGSDADYNDVSLKITGSYTNSWVSAEDVDPEDEEDPFHPLITVDQDGGPWLILCEDLGNGADNDFNDIIFKVYRKSATKMVIEYMAGGSTIQDYVLFNNAVLAEIHDVFGVDLSGYNPDDPDAVKPNWFVNTKMNTNYDPSQPTSSETTWSSPVKSAEIAVAEGLSMSTFYRTDASNSSQGFSVKSKDREEVPFTPSYKGFAPFIICVPADGFRWPAECVSIFDAYPEFQGWAEDHTQNTDWYLHPADDNLVVDLDAVLEMVNQ